MNFNVSEVEWTYPVKNPHVYEYKGRPYVIAENDSDQIKDRYIMVAFESEDPKGAGRGDQNSDIIELHNQARKLIDSYIAEEEKKTKEQRRVAEETQFKEESKKLSDQLVEFGMIHKHEDGSMTFTDLGKRTLQFMRLLHGRITSSKPQRTKNATTQKAPFKRQPRANKAKLGRTRLRAGRILSLKKAGPIFNHRMATFTSSVEAEKFVSALKKRGFHGATKPAAKGSRCHVIVPFREVSEIIPVLREFRHREAG